MPLESSLKAAKRQLDAQIISFFPKNPNARQLARICGKARYALLPKAAKESLHKPIWDLLNRGGKRWRPALMLLVSQAFGASPKKILPYSIIPEIIHNGTLMVDDVEDNSDLRRGKSAIHKIYGMDIAINAGNAMYYLPLKILLENPAKFPPATINAAYSIYVQEMINLSYGQGFDILWHRGQLANISESDYLQMCAFKTGTLARMAAKLGALFALASPKDIELAGEFAESIGIAFQIQDDILNLTASEEYGKEIGGDISEGKRTLIVIRALKMLNPNQRHRLLHILNSQTKDQLMVGEAMSLIRGTDALDYSARRAQSLVAAAWAKFSKALRNSKAKRQLKEFADYLIERTT